MGQSKSTKVSPFHFIRMKVTKEGLYIYRERERKREKERERKRRRERGTEPSGNN